MAAVGGLMPAPLWAKKRPLVHSTRSLAFYNPHTFEILDIDYCVRGKYNEEALNEINYILRDYRTDEIFPIDTKLLDLLYVVSIKLNNREPFQVISGYRSPSTNAMLRKKSKMVAQNSLHLHGQAIDICLPKTSLKRLRNTVIGMNAGGVGYYPNPGFIHVDIGRIRYW
jgi:uncharacterized protein YcbK (DUF882 family)